MSLFGKSPDPKDEIISLLTNERDYLRLKVTELEGQLLAINNAHAYRILHRGDNPEPPSLPLTATPFAQRLTVFEPDFTLGQVEDRFRAPKD